MSSENLFFESVAEHACKYFSDKLPKRGKPSKENFEWTTMAAIVQSIDEKDCKVVSLGTGTKCIGKNELSPLGDVLSDSHAEVICRRSFLLYLYDQLFLTLLDRETIFQVKNDDNSFELHPLVKFHLFISHVPCGDAAIVNSPIGSGSSDDGNEPPEKKNKFDQVNQDNNKIAIQRTGAKLIVGDNTYEDFQTPGKCRVKPGKGDPTLSMSCSDKIAKWQIMGLQGSLLGNFIKSPILLQSIIIGGLVTFESTSLKRALYDRFSGNEKLTQILLHHSMFQSYSPKLYQSRVNFPNFSSSPIADNVSKPAPASISSYKRESVNSIHVDVSVNGRKQGATKKNFGKPISQVTICRRHILEQFINLCSKYEERFKLQKCIVSSSDLSQMTYKNAKGMNSVYSETWNSIKNEVMIGWTTKPEHLENFCL